MAITFLNSSWKGDRYYVLNIKFAVSTVPPLHVVYFFISLFYNYSVLDFLERMQDLIMSLCVLDAVKILCSNSSGTPL